MSQQVHPNAKDTSQKEIFTPESHKNRPTSLLDDVKHNVRHLALSAQFTIASYVPVYIMYVFVIPKLLDILPKDERFSLVFTLVSASLSLVCAVMGGDCFFISNPTMKKRVIFRFLVISFGTYIILELLYIFVIRKNGVLMYHTILTCWLSYNLGVTYGFHIIFITNPHSSGMIVTALNSFKAAAFGKPTTRPTKVSKFITVVGSFMISCNAVMTTTLSMAYITLSDSEEFSQNSHVVQLLVFGVSYPLMSLFILRVFFLNATEVIIEMAGANVSEKFEEHVYLGVKLIFAVPCYISIININNNGTFVLSMMANVLMEALITIVTCSTLDSKFLIKIKAKFSLQTPSDENESDKLARKRHQSLLFALEEFAESIAVVLCFVLYIKGSISIQRCLWRTSFMYCLVWISDLLQKRIFASNGYYLSRHNIDFTPVGKLFFLLCILMSCAIVIAADSFDIL